MSGHQVDGKVLVETLWQGHHPGVKISKKQDPCFIKFVSASSLEVLAFGGCTA